MPEEPFIGGEERPDLTIDLETKVGDLRVRDLAAILQPGALLAKEKDLFTDLKDRKDAKDGKDAKDAKDRVKDDKDDKDQKDAKEAKELKDRKERKEGKDRKDAKEAKEAKDLKEDTDQKAYFDRKLAVPEGKLLKDAYEGPKGTWEGGKLPKGPGEGQAASPYPPTELGDYITRVSGLRPEGWGQW